jgi:glycosyltransferase involved in cell wall biosynthesis
MAAHEPLSVVVVTRNEEHNLDRCLRSVSWAEEIVVVDAESTDRTRDIAARHGARVVVRPWAGYVEQKNHAVSLAAHLWVLSLDADEWLTDAGALEIRRVLEAPLADGYAFERVTAFCGAFVRWAWHPDRQLRLFRKDRGAFGGGLVHESWKLAEGCRLERLREPFFHLTCRSLREYFERMNRYTDLAADSLGRRGRGFSWWALLAKPPAAFFKMYVFKLGVLDGVRGFLVSAGAAMYVFERQAKLWELRREVDPEFLSAAGSTPEDPDPGALR